MDAQKINQRIITPWETEQKNENLAGYLKLVPQFFFPQLKTEHQKPLLYVGLNPSFSERNFAKLAEKIKDKNNELAELLKTPKKFYSWERNKITKGYLNQHGKIDKYFIGEDFDYYSTAKRIADDCKLNLQATDLFLLRETKQENIRIIIFINKRDGELTEFAKKQIEIFFDIVRANRPHIILIGNALASDIIYEYLKFRKKLEWQENIGTCTTKINNHNIPIFFSGMLSGQRALDKYSRKRLEWQIKRCIKIKVGK